MNGTGVLDCCDVCNGLAYCIMGEGHCSRTSIRGFVGCTRTSVPSDFILEAMVKPWEHANFTVAHKSFGIG